MSFILQKCQPQTAFCPKPPPLEASSLRLGGGLWGPCGAGAIRSAQELAKREKLVPRPSFCGSQCGHINVDICGTFLELDTHTHTQGLQHLVKEVDC